MTNDSAFRATFDARELAAAIKSAGRIIERRNSLAILSNVRIELGDDAAAITGTDLDAWLTVLVPADVPVAARGATVTVAAAAIGAVLGKAAKGAGATLAAQGGRMIVEAGSACGSLPTIPAAEFPMPSDGACHYAPSFTVPAAMFGRDLARLAPAMSSDETRPYLNGVHFGRSDAGALAMTATDGKAAVFIARDGVAVPAGPAGCILPRKSVTTLARLLGKGAAGEVTLSGAGATNRIDVNGDGFWLHVKLVDGTFPDARAGAYKALGDNGVQAAAFPDDEPRLNGVQLARLAKPCGGPANVAMGADGATLTYSDAPEYLGFTMLYPEGCGGGAKGFDYRRADGFERKAVPYLVELARSRGFAVDGYFAPERHSTPCYYPLVDVLSDDRFRLHVGAAGDVIGATFGGIARFEEFRIVEEPDYATLTMRRVRIPEVREYEEGAFSVPMPRERRLAYAAVTIGEGDAERPVRTNDRGEVEMAAAQVRAMAGPVDTSRHVAIPARPAFHGSFLPDGWASPLPVKRDKARKAFAPVADGAGYPFWTGAGERDWRADRAAGLLVTDDGDWNWVDRGAAMVIAEPAAAVAVVDAPQAPLSVAVADAPASVTEADERADVPASPAPTRVCPAVPSPLSPFAVKPAVDAPAEDVAATVAALLARVAALEAVARPLATPAGTGAKYARPGEPGRAAWERQLAAEAGRELPPAQVVDPLAALRADLAAMTAERDALASERDALRAEAEYLHAARDRTAARVRAMRVAGALDRHALGAVGELYRAEAARADAAELAAAALPALHAEVGRLRKLAPLAGIQWGGGHVGASVAPVRPAAPPAPPSVPARLIIADGRRVAA